MPERVRALMTGAMPKVFAAVLAIALVATVSRAATGLWTNADGMQPWDALVRGPWFWIEIIALVAALWLMLSASLRNQGSMQVAAALLTILSLAIGRYEYVVSGQVVPLFKGSWVGGLIDYAPSTTEWMLALLALSVAFVLYGVGERMLNLSATPEKA